MSRPRPVVPPVLTHSPPDSMVPTYRKRAGEEPLPGYVLLEPLGKGGFGEVWKCEAPGGLHKAIKFVSNLAEGSASNSLDVEYEAFQHIKTIRHPFLLTLERVELLQDELVMVMELADRQLQDLFRSFTHQGHQGIPRDDLLSYLSDAAEMLDHISSRHGLQHLDIKPANLFLVCDRVKVGDFGLVRRHELTTASPNADRGMTPRYVAPEILHGRVDPRSDQYCLAIVYQEMLTGVFPYNARSAQQMMLQHVSAAPNLTPLPACDRAAVARAMSKAPTDRFGSCTEFMRSLLGGSPGEDTIDQSHETWGNAPPPAVRNTPLDSRQMRAPRSGNSFELPAAPTGHGVDPASLTGRMTQPPGMGSTLQLSTQNRPQLSVQRRAVPTLSGVRPLSGAAPLSYPAPQGLDRDDPVELVSLTSAPPPIRLPRIWSVLPASWLAKPGAKDFIAPDCATLIETLVMSATPDGNLPAAAGMPSRQADGTWASRFPLRAISGVAKIKLELLKEAWKAEIEPAGPEEFFIRRYNAGGFWDRLSSKGKNGLIVHVRLPKPGSAIGEAVLTGSLFGNPDAGLTRASADLLPEMLNEVRTVLGNADDRRKHVRVPANWSVALHPLTSDGVVGKSVPARLRDVSGGGVCCTTVTQVETAYVYATFPEVPGVANWAMLTRLTRSHPEPGGYSVAGRFRTDL